MLAYWSSDFPATVPPACVPPQTAPVWDPPAFCRHESPKPLFQRVLAWVFTWRTDCVGFGPNSARPRATSLPLGCHAVTFVDATTGERGYSWEGGAEGNGPEP